MGLEGWWAKLDANDGIYDPPSPPSSSQYTTHLLSASCQKTFPFWCSKPNQKLGEKRYLVFQPCKRHSKKKVWPQTRLQWALSKGLSIFSCAPLHQLTSTRLVPTQFCYWVGLSAVDQYQISVRPVLLVVPSIRPVLSAVSGTQYQVSTVRVRVGLVPCQ